MKDLAAQYPRLFNEFKNLNNFAVIAQTMIENFSDLFDLDALEASLQVEEAKDGSYMAFFKACIHDLEGKYTKEELIPQIYKNLRVVQDVKKQYYDTFVIKTSSSENDQQLIASPKQIGFFEKIVTGTVKLYEPLTFLDILRFIQREPKAGNVNIMHLANMQYLNAQDLKMPYLIINFNPDINGVPKWGVLNQADRTVYCETTLTVNEKKALKEALNFEPQYQGGQTNNQLSSGYTMIAKVDQYLGIGWLNIDMDFWTIRYLTVEMMIYHYDEVLRFKLNQEYELCSSEIKKIWERFFTRQNHDFNINMFEVLLECSILGEIGEYAYRRNDIADFIKNAAKTPNSVRLDQRRIARCSNLIGLHYSMARALPSNQQIFLSETNDDEIKLTIPSKIDVKSYFSRHEVVCLSRRINSEIFKQVLGLDVKEHELVNAMVMATFRSRSKKSKINIDIAPNFELTHKNHELLVNIMQDNPFTTELTVNNDNRSLAKLHNALLPLLARNRWLKQNNYKPPLIDNYWRVAAQYWLYYLNEYNDILTNNSTENLSFKRCVKEMSLTGLEAFLHYLEEEQQTIEPLLGRKRPQFYFSCLEEDFENQANVFINYITKDENYFPFNELAISYVPGNDLALINLLKVSLKLNNRFDKVLLTDCLKNHESVLVCLQKLAEIALDEKWLSLIAIPELDDNEHLDSKYMQLFITYRHINNIILDNRRRKIAEDKLEKLNKLNKSYDKDKERKQHEDVPLDVAHEEEIVEPDVLQQPHWPLARKGAVQLQLQLQQEFQQEHVLQAEQRHAVVCERDEPIPEKLISYQNIDRELGDYYNELCQNSPIFTIGSDITRTPLQSKFAKWISANPEVPSARHAISYITKDAAKILLRHDRYLASGLNIENLPRGFYTQHDENHRLVLFYKPELGYVTSKKPLTLNLDDNKPKAETWLGDFRQFDHARYLKQSDFNFNDKSLKQAILLFANLQPLTTEKDIDNEYELFIKTNPQVLKSLRDYEIAKIKRHWPVFLQLWQFANVNGLQAFLKWNENDFNLESEYVLKQLIPPHAQNLIQWLLDKGNLSLTSSFQVALGQLYYQYGSRGVELFCQKLYDLEQQLGEQFFDDFNQAFLETCDNYCHLLELTTFRIFDTLIEALQHDTNKRELWQSISVKHSQAIGWQEISALWRGFEYFYQEVCAKGLKLKPTQFLNISPNNMLICMDRILTCLDNIPDFDSQQLFLDQLAKNAFDLNHGGVFYALQYEQFRHFNKRLALHDFHNGAPSYLPDFDKLYERDWDEKHFSLYVQRLLATKSQFTTDEYHYLCEQLTSDQVPIDQLKETLVLLITTEYQKFGDMAPIVEIIQSLPEKARSGIAFNLHRYYRGSSQNTLPVDLHAIEALVNLAANNVDWQRTCLSHPATLEIATILHHAKSLENDFASLEKLMRDNPDLIRTKDDAELCKIGMMLGIFDNNQLSSLIKQFGNLNLRAKQEARFLFKQLLSVDWQQTTIDNLRMNNAYDRFIECLNNINANLADPAPHRVNYLESLIAQSAVFRYSLGGNYNTLNDSGRQNLPALNAFVDHTDRLWLFLKNHVAIPTDKDPNEALRQFFTILRYLQLKRGIINEVEPLLTSLEQAAKPGEYWTAQYLTQILEAFKPEDQDACYPVTMLKQVLSHDYLKTKKIDELENDFPAQLTLAIQNIVKNTVYSREQQTWLCQLTLREYDHKGETKKSTEILNALLLERYPSDVRLYVFQWMAELPNINQLDDMWDRCNGLLQLHTNVDAVQDHWYKTLPLWLAKLNEPKILQQLQHIENNVHDNEKKTLILHIVAWSALHQGLRTDQEYNNGLERKLNKLVGKLIQMQDADLQQLALQYPTEPCPSADDILRLIKQHESTAGSSWDDCLTSYQVQPFTEPKSDFGNFSATRAMDLQRMFSDLRITRGRDKSSAQLGDITRISLIFAYLKQIEEGDIFINGYRKPITQMTQTEIAEAFKTLSQQSNQNPSDDMVRAQIWALLFIALGRTTRKYPHLAQQFASIANEVILHADMRILQLATGEGKSHFSALRAARHIGLRKGVDTCTAKRSLAERDYVDYKAFLDYLDIKSSHIHSRSNVDVYNDAEDVFTTTGDISLFFDEQRYHGYPIDLKPQNRVGLFDEFDFIRFEEDQKTQYNYAVASGRTPKEMNWFYTALNQFYLENKQQLLKENISTVTIKNLIRYLTDKALDNEAKSAFVESLARDKLLCVQWLQSAYEAERLQKGIDYTVIKKNIEMGRERLPMREIVPLSSDNQKMHGSSFSLGVHQLLAVRLNSEAKTNNQPQDYFVLPESHIVNSQLASVCMRNYWSILEGFSGTISESQAYQLHQEYGAEVLHVPTNQDDLRHWNAPRLFENNAQRMRAVAEQVRKCLANKQSILFACKNDKNVEEMQKELKRLLTPEDFSALIFYTNDTLQTPHEVLIEKREKEQWQEGKKSKGIGLVASGFGRGDNCGVEAVFLMDANNSNDLVQKGGRTARNGAAGNVYQFYVNDELIRNKKDLLAECQRLVADEDIFTSIKTALDKIQAPDEEKLLQQVLLLKEHVALLNNIANHAYHMLLADYCHWGMGQLTLFKNNLTADVYHKISASWSNRLKTIEKQWIEISANDKNVDEKIDMIQNILLQHAKSFLQTCREECGNVLVVDENEFLPKPITTTNKELVTAILGEHQQRALLAKIGRKLATFPSYALTAERMDEIVKSTRTFDVEVGHNKANAEQRLSMLAQSRTIDEFLRYSQTSNGKLAVLMNAHADAKNGAMLHEYLNHNPELRQQLIEQLYKLPCKDQFSDRILNQLEESIRLGASESVVAVLPLLEYLGTFSEFQMMEWGDKYIELISGIVREDSEQLKIRFSMQPMGAYNNERLWSLAKRYAPARESLSTTLKMIDSSITAESDPCLKQLSQWEDIVNNLQDNSQRADFLNHFCQVMKLFSENDQNELFAKLVKATHQWWNKGRDRSYHEQILTFWRHLSKHSYSAELKELLLLGLEQPGKSWFALIGEALELNDAELVNHRGELNNIIVNNALKKQQKLELIRELVLKVQQTSTIQLTWDVWHEVNPSVLNEIVKLFNDFENRFPNNPHTETIRALLNNNALSVPYKIHFLQCCTELKDISVLNDYLLHEDVRDFNNTLEPNVIADYANLLQAINGLLEHNISLTINDREGIKGKLRTLLNNQHLSFGYKMRFMQCCIAIKDIRVLNDYLLHEGVRNFNNTLELNVIANYANLLQVINNLLDQSNSILRENLKTKLRTLLNNQHLSFGYKMRFLQSCTELKDINVLKDYLLHDDLRDFNNSLVPEVIADYANSLQTINALLDASNSIKAEDREALKAQLRNILANEDNQNDKLAFLRFLASHSDCLMDNILLIQNILSIGRGQNLPGIALDTRIAMAESLLKLVKQPENKNIELQSLIDSHDKFTRSIRLFAVEKIRSSLNLMHDLCGSNVIQLDYLLQNALVNTYDTIENNARDAAKIVVKKLHDAAVKHGGDVEQIFSNKTIAGLFNFDNALIKRERITLMHFLNHEVLVANEMNQSQKNRLSYQWTDEKNDALLQKGLAKYVEKAKEILDKKHRKLNARVKHDLTTEQQQGLLSLSRELAIIGRKRLDLSADTDEHVEAMKLNLNKIQSRYTSFWTIKSKQRKEAISNLQVEVNAILNNGDENNGETTRYERVLKAINEARESAIDSDFDRNERHQVWYRFWVNRSGYSAFQHTLNQMHDCVLRHWLQDQKAVQNFKNYEESAKEIFATVLKGFKREIDDHAGNKDFDDLKDYIDVFFRQGDRASLNVDILDDIEKLTELKQAIDDNRSKLPANIRTLAKELLQPIETLIDFYTNNAVQDIVSANPAAA